MNTKQSFTPSRLETISQKPTVKITQKVHSLMNVFHSLVEKVEWSGILFYTIEGTIADISNMVFTLQHIMLKDIGTSAHTSYEFNEDIIDFFDENPECEDMKIGMVHTHHNMNCYFSAEDLSELQNNAKNHNYYLSFITNFGCEYVAKLAIQTYSVHTNRLIKGDDGAEISIAVPGEVAPILVADCTIELDLDDYNTKTYKKLTTAKKAATQNVFYPDNSNFSTRNNFKSSAVTKITHHKDYFSLIKLILLPDLDKKTLKTDTLSSMIIKINEVYKSKKKFIEKFGNIDANIDSAFHDIFGRFPYNDEYIELIESIISTFKTPLFFNMKVSKWIIELLNIEKEKSLAGFAFFDNGNSELNQMLTKELMGF